MFKFYRNAIKNAKNDGTAKMAVVCASMSTMDNRCFFVLIKIYERRVRCG